MTTKVPKNDYTYSVVDDVHCPAAEACPWPAQVAKLESQLLTDTLTGLSNYRHFSVALDQEIERTKRTGASTSLLMLDVDFFKKVNDTWGHEAGNVALKALAGCMRGTFRKLDVVCRYGGEEFAVILPATEQLVAVQVAERFRKKIEKMGIDIFDKHGEPNTIHLTASMGIGLYSRHSDLSAGELVKQADKYLYQAKESGRNQVCYGIHKTEADAMVSSEEKEALNNLFGDSGDEI